MLLFHREPLPPGQKRPPRWGLRTLGFLILGMVALITSVAMGRHTAGTLGSLTIAVLGAGYCSMRGIYAGMEAGLLQRRPPDRRRRE